MWRRGWAAGPPHSQFLSKRKQEFSIRLTCLAEALPQLMKVRRLFPRTAPNNVVRSLPLQQIRQLGRLIALIEELVQWHFQSPGHLLQGLDRGNSVTIFYTRYVTSQQPSSLLDVSLRELLFLPQLPQTITDNHVALISNS